MLAWMNNSVHPTFTHIFRAEKFAAGDAAMAELKRFNTKIEWSGFRHALPLASALQLRAIAKVFQRLRIG
jgi:glutathione S-transferase